jgi:hypothetical protein
MLVLHERIRIGSSMIARVVVHRRVAECGGVTSTTASDTTGTYTALRRPRRHDRARAGDDICAARDAPDRPIRDERELADLLRIYVDGA